MRLVVASSLLWLFGTASAQSEFGNLKAVTSEPLVILWRSTDALAEGFGLALGRADPRAARGLYACVADEGARVMKRAESSVSIPSISSRPALVFQVRVAEGRYAGCLGWILSAQFIPAR